MRTVASSSRWFPRRAVAFALALVVWPRLAWSEAAPTIPLCRPACEYRVHTIDVDQGQAILVQTLTGKNILIDAGEDYAAPRLLGYLKKIGVNKIDWLVISHRHMDHIAGVAPLAKAIPVENVVTPWESNAVPTTALAWLAPLRKDLSKPFGTGNRPAFHTAVTGKVFDFGGGARGEVVWPPKPTGKLKIGDHNEESVVMRVSQRAPGETQDASFVVGGDLGWQLEKHLAKKYPQLLRADGLVGNHHGSQGSFERSYLEAVAGRSSLLLQALDGNVGSKEAQLAQQVIQLSQRENASGLASRVGLQLYRQATSGAVPKDDKLVQSLAAVFQRELQQGRLPWMTYSAGKDNPYHHPNSQRMALATLLGTTMLGTEEHSNIVMTRKVDKDGKWVGPRWEGHTLGNLGLPDVSGDIPEYKKKKDPKNPYDNAARVANYIFSLKQPDPTAAWDDKEQFLAGPGQTANEKFLQVARDARRGKKRFVEQLVAELRSTDPQVKAKAEAFALKWTKWTWHGGNLGKLPWDQGDTTIFSGSGAAAQNSRFARGFAQRLARRFAARNSGLAPIAGPIAFAARNSLLGRGRSATATGTVVTRSLALPQLRPWQAQRNSALGGRLLAPRPAFLRVAPR